MLYRGIRVDSMSRRRGVHSILAMHRVLLIEIKLRVVSCRVQAFSRAAPAYASSLTQTVVHACVLHVYTLLSVR